MYNDNNRNPVNNLDKKCDICEHKNKLRIYFKCDDIKHAICSKCFSKISKNNKVIQCPYCRSDLSEECQNPMSLSKEQLYKINPKKIMQKYIFIHQNFELDPYSKLMTIHSSECEIKLYSFNGTPIIWHKMFIGESGFMYIYDSEYERYTYAIEKGKYQFWDINRISLDL
jgi:hypothetical protein